MVRPMKNAVGVVLALLLVQSCAGPVSQLHDPKGEQSCLIIGSVIADVFQYKGITRTYKYGIDVAIVGRVIENGQERIRGFWAKTDARGYFALSNVPPGEYALKGFRVYVIAGEYSLTVINDLKSPEDRYYIKSSRYIPFTGQYFKYRPRNRIVNLQHNYFILDRGQTVHHRELHRLSGFQLVTGRYLTEPSVPEYFLKRFPKSRWVPFLTKLL